MPNQKSGFLNLILSFLKSNAHVKIRNSESIKTVARFGGNQRRFIGSSNANSVESEHENRNHILNFKIQYIYLIFIFINKIPMLLFHVFNVRIMKNLKMKQFPLKNRLMN